jgi:hypothetical protein
MTQKNYHSNWYTISLSDLKLERDMFSRWLNKVGATENQLNRLKAMENIYLKRLNIEHKLPTLNVPLIKNNKYLNKGE